MRIQQIRALRLDRRVCGISGVSRNLPGFLQRTTAKIEKIKSIGRLPKFQSFMRENEHTNSPEPDGSIAAADVNMVAANIGHSLQ